MIITQNNYQTVRTSSRVKKFAKLKISACKKQKDGTLERRQTTCLTKMTAWLRQGCFETVTVRCAFGWGSNAGTYHDVRDALWFLKENWKDYHSFCKELGLKHNVTNVRISSLINVQRYNVNVGERSHG